MGQPYVGEVRIFAGNFPPNGWMFCEGQLLPISENEALFQLIGTTYGGDGESTFALPDLRGRLPIHWGTGAGGNTFQLAETGGAEDITLTVQQIPTHAHALIADTEIGNTPNPQDDLLAESSVASMYQAGSPATAMAAQSIGSLGGSQPHTNFQPYLCLNFIISLFGIFPSQT
jgi:microcystin-dependent protein